MTDYDWVLFDADDKLFNFDAFAGLQRMMTQFGVAFTQTDFTQYQQLSKPLWVAYQNGAISASDLQVRRFDDWAKRLSVRPQALNHAFLNAMAEICVPMAGAVNLLDSLRGRVKLGIITNGFTQLQRVRLAATGLHKHFDVLVISEEVGVAKPDARIFDHALSLMGTPARERVLMVGDTLESDILGGLNAGMKTCWVNSVGKPTRDDIQPHHEVTSLTELEGLLFGDATRQMTT
jgi:5'-nucleotidase